MQGAPSQYPRIFLSSSAHDSEFAERLRRDLEAAGAQIRYPRLLPAPTPGMYGLEPAAPALAESDWVVLILTPAAVASPSVQSEMTQALQWRLQGPSRDIIVVMATSCDLSTIPAQWATLERIDATQNYQTALAWLLARLRMSPPASRVAPEAETLRGWDGTLRDVAPDAAPLPPPSPEQARRDELATEMQKLQEKMEELHPGGAAASAGKPLEPATPEAPPTSQSPEAQPPAPAWDADEIVRSWDDTPTVIAPRGQDAPPPAPAAPPAPSPAPAPGATGEAHDWENERYAGIVGPPVPSAPAAPSPAPPAPGATGAAPEPPEVLRGGGSWQPSGTPPPPPPPPPYTPPPPGAGEPDRAPAPGYGAPPAPPAPSAPPAQPGQPAPGSPGYPPAPAPSYPPYPPTQGYAPPPAYGAPPNPIAPAPQGGYGYPGPFSQWPAPPASPVAVAEQVLFTAYHVREIIPQTWEPLYVYIALDTPQAQAQVQAAAQQVLAGRMGEFRPAVAAETTWLRRGTELTFVPSVPGCVFNPPEQTVPWQADVQQLAFGMQAVTAPPGYSANGRIQVFTGPLLRADIPISVFVRQPGMYAPAQPQRTFATTVARAYRRVFASYSHRDTAIVQSCETAAQVTGDRYLRDVTLLRSGEQWNDRLMQAIGEADLFQLFWSENAARSPAVQAEWRHALSFQPGRGNFIRPVYWSRQLYPIPPELQAIHFERLSLARLGWGKLRIFLHDNLGIG